MFEPLRKVAMRPRSINNDYRPRAEERLFAVRLNFNKLRTSGKNQIGRHFAS